VFEVIWKVLNYYYIYQTFISKNENEIIVFNKC